jgi:putative redox protein
MGEGTRVLADARGHQWVADEPKEEGGTDDGPTPKEMLLGALGACTAITLRIYAKHKEIPLESVEVSYELIHGEGRSRPAESIRARVRIDGDFDEGQRRRLTQIVGRCPVHRMLEHGVPMDDSVEFAAD